MTSFVIISTDYLLSRWPFLTVRSSVKSTLSWRASGTLMRTSTKNIGSVSHSHLISTQIRVIRTVWSQNDQMLIFRASFLHSTSMPRPSTLTHLTTRSWIGRITCSCGGKNIFLSQITQLRFGWCLKKYSQGVVFSQTSLPNQSSLGKRPYLWKFFIHPPSHKLSWWLQSEYQTSWKMEIFSKIALAFHFVQSRTVIFVWSIWIKWVVAGYQRCKLRRFLLHLLPEVKFNSRRILFPSE